MKKKKLEGFFSHLILVGIVAIVAVVALVLHGNNTTGAATYVQEVDDYQVPCFDNDELNNYYFAGYVHFKNMMWLDYCVDRTLFQWVCKTNQTVNTLKTVELAPRAYECPNGCLNGACLEE